MLVEGKLGRAPFDALLESSRVGGTVASARWCGVAKQRRRKVTKEADADEDPRTRRPRARPAGSVPGLLGQGGRGGAHGRHGRDWPGDGRSSSDGPTSTSGWPLPRGSSGPRDRAALIGAIPVGPVVEEPAGRYGAWYETPEGRLLFGLELACIAPLLAETTSPRLEVGVGSGRFAEALELAVGLDPLRRGCASHPAGACAPCAARPSGCPSPPARSGQCSLSRRSASPTIRRCFFERSGECSGPVASSSSGSFLWTVPGVARTTTSDVPVTTSTASSASSPLLCIGDYSNEPASSSPTFAPRSFRPRAKRSSTSPFARDSCRARGSSPSRRGHRSQLSP